MDISFVKALQFKPVCNILMSCTSVQDPQNLVNVDDDDDEYPGIIIRF